MVTKIEKRRQSSNHRTDRFRSIRRTRATSFRLDLSTSECRSTRDRNPAFRPHFNRPLFRSHQACTASVPSLRPASYSHRGGKCWLQICLDFGCKSVMKLPSSEASWQCLQCRVYMWTKSRLARLKEVANRRPKKKRICWSWLQIWLLNAPLSLCLSCMNNTIRASSCYQQDGGKLLSVQVVTHRVSASVSARHRESCEYNSRTIKLRSACTMAGDHKVFERKNGKNVKNILNVISPFVKLCRMKSDLIPVHNTLWMSDALGAIPDILLVWF